MTESSDTIVLVRTVGSKPGTGSEMGTVDFNVSKVLKGQLKKQTLSVKGRIADYSPRMKALPPYEGLDCSRAAGCGGCHAYDYKLGHSYLMFLRSGDPYWAPLVATNEEVTGGNDSWVLWVTQKLSDARRLESRKLKPSGVRPR